MLSQIKHSVDEKVSNAAHVAALGSVMAITLMVGLGFLTLAAWLVLVTLMTTTQAALVLGSVYLGISLITLTVIMMRGNRSTPERSHQPVPDTQTAVAEVITAFAGGVTAGRQARSGPR